MSGLALLSLVFAAAVAVNAHSVHAATGSPPDDGQVNPKFAANGGGAYSFPDTSIAPTFAKSCGSLGGSQRVTPSAQACCSPAWAVSFFRQAIRFPEWRSYNRGLGRRIHLAMPLAWPISRTEEKYTYAGAME